MIEFLIELFKENGYHLNIDDKLGGSTFNELITVDWAKLESRGAILIDYSSIINSELLKSKLDLTIFLSEDAEGGVHCAEKCELFLNALGLAIHTLCFRESYKPNVRCDVFKSM